MTQKKEKEALASTATHREMLIAGTLRGQWMWLKTSVQTLVVEAARGVQKGLLWAKYVTIQGH